MLAINSAVRLTLLGELPKTRGKDYILLKERILNETSLINPNSSTSKFAIGSIYGVIKFE